jgi:hypothetical protein
MIGLIVTLIIVGVLLWAVEMIIPLDATIRRVIEVVIVLCVLLYVLRFFAVL